VVGAMCGVGLMSYPASLGLLLAAAVLGNQSNYTIGRYFGPKVFQWEDSRYFNKNAFNQAHAFYEKYGGITIIAARFMPFLRTFAPFVAGVARMTRHKFSLYDVTGGALWVGGITIVAARFMPFLRTFAPFVAGVARMTRHKFSLYDVTGGALWVGSIVTAGYFFGSVPWVKANLEKIIWAMIIIPGLVILFGAWRSRRKAAASA